MTMHGSKPIVLVIDDTPDTHKLITFLLRDFHAELKHAFGASDGLAMAAASKPDLILLDYLMPEVDGLEVLQRLRAIPFLKSTPVIFITSSDDPLLIAEVFSSGASDYIRKPLLAPELQARVRASLKTHALVQELSHQANFDALTGLPNRWSMLQSIENALKKQKGFTQPNFALLHIDFDRFRLINESLGRDVGDSILIQIAERIQRVVSSSIDRNTGSLTGCLSDRPVGCRVQSASRLEGDGFVVLVDQITNVLELNALAEKLLRALSDRYWIGPHSLYVDSSIGIVISDPKYGSADELLRDADNAMHAAKTAGRHRFQIFNDSMRKESQRRLELNNDLRLAIEKHEFELVYQPLVQLSTGKTVSVEALIRWNHRTRGVVNPCDFIPFAEETGLINDIGDWCLYTACEQFARWNRDFPSCAPREININIARQQLIQPSFIDDLKHVLNETGVAGDSLHLELTESEIMTDTTVAIAVMKELRNLGLKIDIDDFGTGHSSLACLSEFPIDVLKLDRSLIAGVSEVGFSAKLVELVLELAISSSVSVVAEGIETTAQAEILVAWGCEFGQGYLFAKPLPAHLVPIFINDQFRYVGKMKPRRAKASTAQNTDFRTNTTSQSLLLEGNLQEDTDANLITPADK